jgi:hypothetical protein
MITVAGKELLLAHWTGTLFTLGTTASVLPFNSKYTAGMVSITSTTLLVSKLKCFTATAL